MSTSTARRQEDRSPEQSYVSSQHTRTNADEAGRGESAQDELRGNSEHDPLLKDAVGVDNEFSLG